MVDKDTKSSDGKKIQASSKTKVTRKSVTVAAKSKKTAETKPKVQAKSKAGASGSAAKSSKSSVKTAALQEHSSGLFINTLQPAVGSRQAPRRVGRGPGSDDGKTAGRGHKGQKSRSGSRRDAGFEGGQMPIQMRLPKFGFTSRVGRVTAKIRLGELSRLEGDVLDLDSLRKSKIVNRSVKRARVFLSGNIDRKLSVRGVTLSKGARAAIEKAGGKIEEGTQPSSKDA
jgi:large subunit ribosomal protein L15